ncbi:hypothetical protein SAMN05444146_2707 [Flavobacterium johnsoniae]|jgi:hypothetical protein|uniref:Uncharacterized protein n=3 Tax=Flavobacteriaceae TaxID=49546 RepID=A0A1M5IZW0_FLAJO|nr:hypothetical protein Fjoh_4768 [Flavobacterium johnsoniae UW101]SHG33846.1 hypothetical protein SAMN05444388_102324 [Flavobacterium johnsoniae]SHL02638.1 hypothetical protein SAMN05444146_2707 [Flavobacterium johnsoniae]
MLFVYICCEFKNIDNPQKSYFIMSKMMFDYTKSILERVSFDPVLFCKELEKAIKTLLPYEMEQLQEWLLSFVIEKPELKPSLQLIKV